MTQLKYDWPEYMKKNFGKFPLMLTVHGDCKVEIFLIKDEEDFVKHLIACAKKLYDAGFYHETPILTKQEFYFKRMGFSIGFFDDVFRNKGQSGMVSEICDYHFKVIQQYNDELAYNLRAKKIADVIATGEVENPYDLWMTLANYKIPVNSDLFLSLKPFNTL
jgi:hypothetical protein